MEVIKRDGSVYDEMKHLIEMAESYLKNQTPDGENMLNNRLQVISIKQNSYRY